MPTLEEWSVTIKSHVRGAGRLIVEGYAIYLTLRRLGTFRGFTIHGLTTFWVLPTDYRL
mgnify:CR=1 FL=1